MKGIIKKCSFGTNFVSRANTATYGGNFMTIQDLYHLLRMGNNQALTAEEINPKNPNEVVKLSLEYPMDIQAANTPTTYSLKHPLLVRL